MNGISALLMKGPRFHLPWEETARKQPAESQEAGPHHILNILAPGGFPHLQNGEE